MLRKSNHSPRAETWSAQVEVMALVIDAILSKDVSHMGTYSVHDDRT